MSFVSFSAYFLYWFLSSLLLFPNRIDIVLFGEADDFLLRCVRNVSISLTNQVIYLSLAHPDVVQILQFFLSCLPLFIFPNKYVEQFIPGFEKFLIPFKSSVSGIPLFNQLSDQFVFVANSLLNAMGYTFRAIQWLINSFDTIRCDDDAPNFRPRSGVEKTTAPMTSA